MAQASPANEQALIALYVWAEGALLDGLAQIMRRLAAVPADLRAALGRMLTRRLTARVAGVLNQQTPALVDRLMPGPPDAAPPSGGGPGAPFGGPQPPGRPYGADAVAKIRADLVSELDDVRFRITRLDDDMYKLVAPEHAITQVSGATPQEAQAAAWRDFIRRGVTGFTDKSGRRWQLSSYVEMAVRTATNRARNAARIDQITASGGNLVYVSDDGHPCPLCYPWQHRVLAITPDGQHPTIEDATIAGLFHPNAILGDQGVRVLGVAENGVKAWYSGPSVNLTTARGHHLTVSPDHPVLTATGWLPAKALREGMQVFSTPGRQLTEPVPVADVNLDNPESTFEHELDSLAALGGKTTIPAAADDLHGDGRFIQGEIQVVVADRRLLTIVESRIVEQSGEAELVRADVQALLGTSARAALLDSLCVHGAVARSLTDADAAAAEATQDRRAADAESLGEILGGLAAGVEADELVDVEWDRYEGHAYDLQTSAGAYIAASILVHNCRHTVMRYFPGITRLPEPQPWTAQMQAAYDATQKQRTLERRIRAAKRDAAYGATPDARAAARGDVRDAQAKLRAHLADNADLNLLRRPRREQPNLSMK